MKLRINYNLQCEVDHKKSDCKREPSHCHVTRNGVRVAQVWLDPIRIESGHSLDRSEVNDALEVISSNRYDLMSITENTAQIKNFPRKFRGFLLFYFKNLFNMI